VDPLRVFVRDKDGAVFKLEAYGERKDRSPIWELYRGRLNGRTAYIATGAMLRSTIWMTGG
jgi:hypothetical protein